MANTYELIASVTVGAGGASTIDFTSIPSTYTDLVVKLSVRGSNSAIQNTLSLKFNGSATGYTNRVLVGDGSTAASYNNNFTTSGFIGDADGNTATANTFANQEIYIPNYAGSNNKSFSVDSVEESNVTGVYTELNATLWSNTSAITSISIIPNSGGNIMQYSTAYLYGVKNA